MQRWQAKTLDKRAAGGVLAAVLIAAAWTSTAAGASAAPVDVTVARLADGRETLMRAGKPFFIKGAGGDASKPLLKSCGANSFRTWGAETLGADLDAAQRNGLTVAAGIWLGHRDQGFDYHNPDQIARQRAMVRDVVLKYRDHPALLVWSLGNEMEGEGDDPAVWQAVNDLAKMVKQLDPHHPVMTVICEFVDKKVKSLNTYCPDVDIVGLNSYASAPTVGHRYAAAGGVKPYVLTEFGPPGQWEQPKTAWGASLEMPSTAKAAWYKNAYLGSVTGQPLCLGSYAFLWGTKQEATATWYGMLLADGSQTAAVDTMRSLWTGKPSPEQAPAIQSLKIDGPETVSAGTTIHAALNASAPQGQTLKYDWVLTADREASNNGGQAEAPLDSYPDAVMHASADGADVKAPSPGAYRLFAYVHGPNGQAAVANVPFLVTGDGASASAGSSMVRTVSADSHKGPVPTRLPYTIYGKGASSVYIPSGYMGNTLAIKMNPNFAQVQGPSGGACLQVLYLAADNWGGVVWQSPANDWGDKPGGLNLTGAKTLSFWAKGARGGEGVTFKYGILGSDKHFHDTSTASLDVHLTPQWKKYSISVAGKDLSDIKTGFVWVVKGSGKPIAFYLDDVRYE